MKRRLINTQISNANTYQMYLRQLLTLAENVFEFKDLPSYIDTSYMNKVLLHKGSIAFFKDDVLDEILALPYITIGKLDVYGRPINIKVIGKNGYNISKIKVDNNGFINIEELENTITDKTILVSIIYANNEIGVIQNINEIGKVCKKHNIIFHTDAVQAFGHIKIDVKKDNIDLLSVSGHKFGAPKGIGFLYINKNIKRDNLIDGGGQEKNKRGGTENVSGIISLCKAAEITYDDIDKKNNYLLELRNYCIDKIKK